MGMPALLTQNGTGTSATWTPDWMQVPFNIAIGTIVTGAAGYSIEFTLDNLDTALSTGVTWYAHATITALSVNTTGNIQFPVRGLRINLLTAGSINSAVSANFIQATFGR